MSIPTGAAFAKALEAAGIISDLNSITRVVIDITGAECHLYVERVGDKKLLYAIKGPLGMMLADLAAEPEYVPEHAAYCDRRSAHQVPEECLNIHPVIEGDGMLWAA